MHRITTKTKQKIEGASMHVAYVLASDLITNHKSLAASPLAHVQVVHEPNGPIFALPRH